VPIRGAGVPDRLRIAEAGKLLVRELVVHVASSGH
jgi:hypothetical protein